MAVSTEVRTSSVSIAEAKARFSELVRLVELKGETIIISRRGKDVAKLSPITAPSAKGNIATDLIGLFADHPEACDEIDKVYAERYKHKPRYVEF